VLLLPEEPPGTVVSRTPGAFLLRAALSWEEAPREGVAALASALDPAPIRGSFHAVYGMTSDTAGRVACEVRSFYRRELARSLDRTLRAVNSLAALTGAVLELGVERIAGARVFSPDRRRALSRSLSGHGLLPREAASLVPVGAGPDLCLGVGALLDELRPALLRDGWEVVGVWTDPSGWGRLSIESGEDGWF